MKVRIPMILLSLLLSMLFIVATAPAMSNNLDETELSQPKVTDSTIPTYSNSTIPSAEADEITTKPTEVVGIIETEPSTEPTVLETEPIIEEAFSLTDEEKDMLLRIGMCEAGGEGCTECIAFVMLTVLNRVESDDFRDTIDGVLHEKNQFTPVATGWFYNVTPNKRCYEALELVMSGWDESQGALFFESCKGESWHSRNLEFLFQHCNTRFYK